MKILLKRKKLLYHWTNVLTKFNFILCVLSLEFCFPNINLRIREILYIFFKYQIMLQMREKDLIKILISSLWFWCSNENLSLFDHF